MNVRNGTGGSSSNASTRPFAGALSVGLEFHNRDETSGERVSNYCVETKLEADAELIRTACFWPSTCSTSRRRRAPPLAGDKKSTLAFQIVPNVVVGVDLWYLRHYQGVAFNSLTGDAVYLRPTFFWKIGPKVLMSAAWKLIAGREIGASEPRST
jgi:hypothetical protein